MVTILRDKNYLFQQDFASVCDAILTVRRRSAQDLVLLDRRILNSESFYLIHVLVTIENLVGGEL